MSSILHKRYGPSREVLDQCHRVAISPMSFGARKWAKENCKSFVHMAMANFATNSPEFVFYFTDKKDAVYFGLKWV